MGTISFQPWVSTSSTVECHFLPVLAIISLPFLTSLHSWLLSPFSLGGHLPPFLGISSLQSWVSPSCLRYRFHSYLGITSLSSWVSYRSSLGTPPSPPTHLSPFLGIMSLWSWVLRSWIFRASPRYHLPPLRVIIYFRRNVDIVSLSSWVSSPYICGHCFSGGYHLSPLAGIVWFLSFVTITSLCSRESSPFTHTHFTSFHSWLLFPSIRGYYLLTLMGI